MLNGKDRWCLWLVDATPGELRGSAILRERLARVQSVRLNSDTASVRAAARTPALFTQIRQPARSYLALPEVSSQRRLYVPAAFFPADVIAGNKLITFPDADLWLFGMLQSSMFMAWIRTVAGRLKNDPSISPDLTYCTFPFPEPTAAQRVSVEEAARAVLDTRATHGPASLEDLYDPLAMPVGLLRAHQRLDRVIDRLFAPRRRFTGDADRLEVLFERYTEMTSEGRIDLAEPQSQAVIGLRRSGRRSAVKGS